MGISYRYAKYLSKLGTRMLIASLVLDTAWTLVRFIVIHTTFGGNPPVTFEATEKIVTTSIYLTFIVILAVGMMLLGFYYLRWDKNSIHFLPNHWTSKWYYSRSFGQSYTDF